MAFLETPRFPDRIALGALGGPGYRTEIVVTDGGYERRDGVWSAARAVYELAQVPRTAAEVAELLAFFRAVRGRLHGFRFQDPADYLVTTADGVLGTGVGDGTAGPYQMRKLYAAGALSEARDISKPVATGLHVYVAGVERPQGGGAGQCSIDTTTGRVTFGTPYPTSGQALTWAGTFDLPVRFDGDEMRITYLEPDAYAWGSIRLVEIRP